MEQQIQNPVRGPAIRWPLYVEGSCNTTLHRVSRTYTCNASFAWSTTTPPSQCAHTLRTHILSLDELFQLAILHCNAHLRPSLSSCTILTIAHFRFSLAFVPVCSVPWLSALCVWHAPFAAISLFCRARPACLPVHRSCWMLESGTL